MQKEVRWESALISGLLLVRQSEYLDTDQHLSPPQTIFVRSPLLYPSIDLNDVKNELTHPLGIVSLVLSS